MKNPLPIPFGWFMIGYSDELAPGELKNVHYFSRDMVLFRTESGEVGLTDPYCPHLGAHLGEGGEVVGESIRCPFHHWQYDTSGVVTDVPYAKQIPPKIQGKPCLKTYPVQEKNQMIWAWYHPEETEPSHDVIQLEEFSKDDWISLDDNRMQWEFASCPQEVAENGVDAAHFKYVHGHPGVPEGDTSYDGITRQSSVFIDDNPDSPVLKITQHGAGQKWVHYYMGEHIQMVSVTPINDNKVVVHFTYLRKNYAEDSSEYETFKMFSGIGLEKKQEGKAGIDGDIPIWHNKAHLRNPILCDGDGPIMQFRKYFAQFYVGGSPYNDEAGDSKIRLVS